MNLDLAGLLTIDVASELRKLSQAQLQGPWQLPAELVRRALRAGACRVSVDLGSHQVRVTDDGPGLDPTIVAAAAVVVDGHRPNDERHRALTILERAGELALLALAGLPHQELAIDTSDGLERTTLICRPGLPAALARTPSTTRRTEITLRVPGLDRRKAHRWLVAVARFAPVPVMVDGAPVADGFADALAQAPLAAPLRGRVALLAGGDTAHATLLAHGIATAHITIPEAPAFEAAVELGSAEGDALGAARLREAVTADLPSLVDQAVALLARTAHRTPWPEPARARLAQLTLVAARRRLRSPEIERVAVFRSIAAQGTALIDLAALRENAAGGSLRALLPGQRRESYALGTGPVLVAGDAERSLLAEVLSARFRTPDRRQSPRSPAAMARRLIRQAGIALGDLIELVGHPLRRPALAEDALTSDERALLSALREQLRIDGSVADAVLCEGRGPLRGARGQPPVLTLPRHNPTVAACVRAFGADPNWMRIIHAALTAPR